MRQTQRAFVNWPSLLSAMVGQKLGHGSVELTFITRTGLTMFSPNVPGARLPIYEQFADDSYDLARVLNPFRDREARVFDIGSHIGSFALHVAMLLPRASVECFEPSPSSAEYLRRNIGQNSLTARVAVHEVALAGEEGSALLDDNDGGSVHNGLVQGNGRLVAGVEALGQRHSVPVDTTTFDSIVASTGPPDIVKMDCEGGEYDLVYSSSPESWASVTRVVMEYHAVPGQSWDELRSWFSAAGLQVMRHEPIAPGLGTAWLLRSDPLGSV